MRCYTKPHTFSCGIDLHARTMYVWILNRDGEVLLHRALTAAPEPFLKAIAPSREDIVGCVEGLFTWYWLADLCTREGLPFVLGHALYLKAIHGGKAKHAKIDAHKIAGWLRGGMLPQASGYPAEMRATRDLLRRRMPRMRKRAEWLAHIHNTHSQDHLPAIGKQLAYQANRDGVADRFADPAVQKRIAVELALIDTDDHWLTDLELDLVQTAKAHEAQTCSRLRSIPGVGKSLALVLLYEIHAIRRFPRVQACVSYGRLVTCAQESAGTRDGTSGKQIGNASRKWAFSEAAVRCLRNNPAGQKVPRAPREKPWPGQSLHGPRPYMGARGV